MNLRNTSRAESCLLSREAGRERKEKRGRDEKVKTKKMGEKGQSDQAEECEAALSFPLPLNHLQCFSFTQTVLSCVPLLPPRYRSETTAVVLVMTLDKVEPLVLILEFLSCHGTRDMQCLPF